MKYLGIDTTRKKAKVFKIDTENAEQNMFIDIDENIKHSEGMFLYIEKLLLDTDSTIKDYDGYVTIVGPGSFTGIRVGMATIKAFGKATKKPIIPINTFEILKGINKNAVILLQCTKNSWYYADIVSGKIGNVGVVNTDKIVDLIGGKKLVVLKDEQKYLDLEYKNINIVENFNNLYVEALKEKLNGVEKFEVVPYYIQLSQAERNEKHE